MKGLLSILLAGVLSVSCSSADAPQSRNTADQHAEEAFAKVVNEAMIARATNKATDFAPFAAEDIVRTDNGVTTASNREEYSIWMAVHSAAFPNGETRIELAGVANGRAFTYWTFTGKNSGPMGDAPPTNRDIVTHGFSVWRFNSDGKVVREDVFYDELGTR